MCLSLDQVLFNICWCLKEIRATWKNPSLAPSWKTGLGSRTGQAPMAGGMSPSLSHNSNSLKPCLVTHTHAYWSCSSLQHSWSNGKEANNMHLGTDPLSDAHASLQTQYSHEWQRLSTTECKQVMFYYWKCRSFSFIYRNPGAASNLVHTSTVFRYKLLLLFSLKVASHI